MNKTSVALLASLALFTNVAGAAKGGALDEGRNSPVAVPESIPWSELGTRADRQKAPQFPVLSQDQATLAAPLQALSTTVTSDGLAVDSTSAGEGTGTFRLTPISLDKGGTPLTLTSGQVSTEGNAVILDRGALREVLTTSAEGVRQDFIVTAPPEGTQPLALTIDVRGATASQAGDNVALTLPGGRKLIYCGLLVTDAIGKVLQASLSRHDDETLRIVVADAGSTYPLTIDPTITDNDWFALGLGTGTPGYVLALAVDGTSNLYAGGHFFTAGGVTVNHIAKWDGSNWSALGLGTNGQVSALAVDDNGNLYVGGNFTTAGGVAASRIAKWDGNSWSAIGSGMNSHIYSLLVDGRGNLYVGGSFTIAGGMSAGHIAMWNGSSWSPLGFGVNGTVNALAVDNLGNVYAGGSFTIAGLVTAYRIAKWDGGSWSALGLGVGGIAGSVVLDLALDGSGTLYVGGYFRTAGGVAANNIAKWDGGNWFALSTGTTCDGCSGAVRAVALDGAGNLYAGGNFSTAGGVEVNDIARWNGRNWSALGSGVLRTGTAVEDLAIDHSSNLYVGGNFFYAGGERRNNIAGVRLNPPLMRLVALPDHNEDGKGELALLRDGSAVAEVRDGATGILITSITAFGAGFTPIAGTALPDTDGDGKPELAVLATRDSDGRAAAEIHNVGGNSPVRTIWFSAGITPITVKTIAGDADGNGVPELAVLATRDSDGRALVEVKNAYGPTNPHTIWAASGYAPLDLGVVPDSDGNGVPEVAVLSRRNSDGRIVVEVKNAAGPTNPNSVWFGNRAIDFAVVADKDGNGIPEVAVLSGGGSDGRLVTGVKNVRGPTNPSAIWFAAGHTGLALEALGDADGNAAPEIAVLSWRDSDGRVLVEVKNATGPTNPRSLWYPAGYTALDLAILNDVDGNGIDEAAVMMTRDSDGRILVQSRNAAGSQAPKDYWFSP